MPATKEKSVVVPENVAELAQKIAERAIVGDGPDIHHMVRGLGNYSNHAEGVFTVEEVDEQLRVWLSAGYKLHTIHHGGSIKSQTSGAQVEKLIYVLIKE